MNITSNPEAATAEQVHAAQAVYTPRTLALYDTWVVSFSNRWIWKCPSGLLLDFYQRHITGNHLEVGVGTGYFLDHCHFDSTDKHKPPHGVSAPRIALLDINPQVLQFASLRLARFHPEVYQQDVLQLFSVDCPRFDSISCNYLFHCLPGTLPQKLCVLDHLLPLMNPQAVLFGSTIVNSTATPGWASRCLSRLYNWYGVFSNQRDDVVTLERELRSRFKQVTLKVIGSVALFSARP